MKRRDLFPTPIFVAKLSGREALNAELRERFLAESEQAPGLQMSNAGGWHSEQDLLIREEPCFRALQELLIGGFRQLVSQHDATGDIGGAAWAMVMREGDHSTPHHHAEAHWAGVYVVDPGEVGPGRAGHLTLLDPRAGAWEPLGLCPSHQDIKPVAGLLLYFPGWLMHHVHPNRGSGPRVTVSINLQLVP